MRFDIRFDSAKWTAKRNKLNVKRLHFIPKNFLGDTIKLNPERTAKYEALNAPSPHSSVFGQLENPTI